MTRAHSSPAKCDFIPTFFIKDAAHAWTFLIWSCKHLRHILSKTFDPVGLEIAFPKGVVRPPVEQVCIKREMLSICLTAFPREGEWKIKNTDKADFFALFYPTLITFSPPLFLFLPTVALKWLGKRSGGSWPVCIQCLHCCSIITPANQSTLQQLLCSSVPPPPSLLTLCLSVYPPLYSSY